MAINTPPNTLLKLPLGTATASINFTTDGAGPTTIVLTATANDNNFTVADNTSMAIGSFYSIEGGGAGGAVPWVGVYNGQKPFGNTTVCACAAPAVVVSVTAATSYKYERVETRYRAKKVVLTDNTNGDQYLWDQTLLDDQAMYTPSGSNTATKITTRAILNRSNCIAFHPNLLPAGHSFTLKCDYDYYVPAT